jgi:hypothetical protein
MRTVTAIADAGPMNLELEATTAAGAQLVMMAAEHAVDFTTRASHHDRDARFPFETSRRCTAAACSPAAYRRSSMGSASNRFRRWSPSAGSAEATPRPR